MAAFDWALTDAHLSQISSQPLHPMSNPPSATPLHLSEFLNLPPPLARLLLDSASFLVWTKWSFEVASWESPRASDSWLALAGWWALCLVTDRFIRYLLPFAFILCLPRLHHQSALFKKTVMTEQSVYEAAEAAARIQALLPSLPQPPPLQPPIVVRAIAVLLIPHLVLVYLVRLRVILAIVGSVILTWRAPWARSLRDIISQSSLARRAVNSAWSFISGQPLPAPSQTASVEASHAGTHVDTSLRFLFTIYENQRWWVGLDWTAALVPGERPSWCTKSQQAMSPPAAFALPPTTTVFTPDGKDGRIKRTARWTWDEREWKLVVKKESSGGLAELKRVEKEPPSLKEDPPSGNMLAKSIGKLKVTDSSPEQPDPPTNEDQCDLEEPLTDADGWVFCDNKWEGGSSKGGIGKFTRYRRWTRVALLVETVEHVGPGELGIIQAPPPLPPLPDSDLPDKPTQDPPATLESSPSLRQRLRAAVKNAS